MDTTRTHVQLPVTVGGVTRTLPFQVMLHGKNAWSVGLPFTARIGRGTKTHAADAIAWKYDTAAEARRKGYLPHQIMEVDGQVWALNMTTNVLNRQAQIIGYREDAEATSRHIMEATNR
jgi:hypothetical protein